MNDGLDFLFDGITPRPPRRPPEEPEGHRWGRRLRRLALSTTILVSAGTVGVLAIGYLTSSDLTGQVSRVGEVFGPVESAERPVTSAAVQDGRSILAIGAELRGPDRDGEASNGPQDDPAGQGQGGGPDGSAADRYADDPPPDLVPAPAPADDEALARIGQPPAGAIMLIRFDPRDDSASVISIPYLTRVDVPGHGRSTIAGAYALGGPTLLVRTVEQLTDARVDHFMVVDFEELAPVVDVLGGVDVTVAAEVTDRSGVRFHGGVNQLDGARARAYLRQPANLPDGTVDRIQRQQNLLRALLVKVASPPPDANALTSYRLLDALTRAVSVDDHFGRDELREVAQAAGAVGTDSIWFLTAPTGSTTSSAERGAPDPDLVPDRRERLWEAFKTGTVGEYVTQHPEDLLPPNPA
ncbi:LCP family protein [Micromonospora sp. NBC_01796]|uniref:LCP family protein n=1 Tax=Micromonospora sp. NBC_01796 TaxID=2975987 RepID=UPI002DDB672C|nr:LCP family protein [Micromonospora sp. NBC_01796]WSA84683.1 LCP family protein [Micromonospora sp. NBC_01796]